MADRLLALLRARPRALAPPRPAVRGVYALSLVGEEPLSWAVLHTRDGDDAWRLAVPADGMPLLGRQDVGVATTNDARLSLRCGRPTWIWAGLLAENAYVGELDVESLALALAVLRGQVPGAGLDEDEPELVEWEQALDRYGETLRLHQLAVAPQVVPALAPSTVDALLNGALSAEEAAVVVRALMGAADNRALLLPRVREAVARKASSLGIPGIDAIKDAFLLAATARETAGLLALADSGAPLTVLYDRKPVPDPERVSVEGGWSFRRDHETRVDLGDVTVPGLLPGCRATLLAGSAVLAGGTVGDDCTVVLVPVGAWAEVVRDSGAADARNLLPPSSTDRLILEVEPLGRCG